jgi:signal transduction histidine kinase
VEFVGSAGLWQIEVDPNHLETALLNLAINARDAMPEGGKLTLESSNVYIDEDYGRLNQQISPGQFVMIAVSDTGTGMAREVVDRAFEPFFTTKRRRNRRYSARVSRYCHAAWPCRRFP